MSLKGKKLAVLMDKRFVDWWNERPIHNSMKEDQIMMLIAWWAWVEGKKQGIADTAQKIADKVVVKGG